MEEIQQKKVAMISPDGKKSFVPLTEFMSKVRYANLANVKIRDLENNRDYNPTYKKYTKSQIVTYLANPANYEVQLRQMSQYLFNISNYYRRLIQYFAQHVVKLFAQVVVNQKCTVIPHRDLQRQRLVIIHFTGILADRPVVFNIRQCAEQAHKRRDRYICLLVYFQTDRILT